MDYVTSITADDIFTKSNGRFILFKGVSSYNPDNDIELIAQFSSSGAVLYTITIGGEDYHSTFNITEAADTFNKLVH